MEETYLEQETFEAPADGVEHYGTPRHSGRYPWGSGENPYQRSASMLAWVKKLEEEGLSEAEIAQSVGSSVEDIRGWKSAAKNAKQAADVAVMLRWKDKGMSNVEIGRRMGIPESSVRSMLGPATAARLELRRNTADFLKQQLAEKPYLDVGKGTELHIGVSASQLKQALYDLELEGYNIHTVKVEQVTTGKDTTYSVLVNPGVTWSDTMKNRAEIRTVAGWSDDGGRTFNQLEVPVQVDPSRIQIAYESPKDGLIEVRRGVEDLSMGNSTYAQVRILTDTGVPDDKYGSTQRYLKGMAIYSDDLPSGVDIRYNVSKPAGTPAHKVFKGLDNDDDELQPWKATTSGEKAFQKQHIYLDADGNEHRSAINIVSPEGTWAEWKHDLSSQMMSKQPVELARKQLAIQYDRHVAEFEELASLTNPVIRNKLLADAAGNFDKAAEDLSAAALPHTGQHVILPIPSMSEKEIYATNYKNGDRVVLIRHPHAGIFEIPELVVNNRQPEARRVMGQATDAVGINPKVAAQLSGADFDGDTVLVIPNPRGEIKTSSPLKGLKDFEPRIMYEAYAGMPRMTKQQKAVEMGGISNLITDMTLQGATEEEMARAVRHSMVVIDAEKHHLNYKQSESDNGIAQLRAKYQPREKGPDGGASTIISKAGGRKYLPAIKRYDTDPSTGELIPIYAKKKDPQTGEMVPVTKMVPVKKLDPETGEMVIARYKEVPRQTQTTKMMATSDAHTLVSKDRWPTEVEYADYANRMKALANEARRQSMTGGSIEYSPSAAKAYAQEVDALNAKLRVAQARKPLERQAQVLANAQVRARQQADPYMEPDTKKKIKNQALAQARTAVGIGQGDKFLVSDNEWKAIQAGAINKTKLLSIMEVADSDRLRKLATPRKDSTAQISESRVRALLAAGLTQAEVAEKLGISTTTVNRLAK